MSTAKQNNVPALRFPEFTSEWQPSKLENVCDRIQDGTHFSPQVDEFGDYKYITSKNIRNGFFDLRDISYISEEAHRSIYARCDVKFGDVLLTKDGASTGNVCLNTLDEEFSLLSSVAFLRGNKSTDNRFLYQIVLGAAGQSEIKKVISGQAITRITLAKIRDFKFYFPLLKEQQKIADFLGAVDTKIQQLKRERELMQQYKKGVMQQLFSQQVRFKDDDGRDYPDWEEKRLGDIAQRVLTKNTNEAERFVLTNSATQGIVSQQDYFDKDIANQGNLGGYYVVDVDDFVYNPRISVSAPVGPIKCNHLRKGVMSPLYTVFRFYKKPLNFFEHFFATTFWHEYMESVANYGARHDRMNITNKDFLDMPIPMPCEEEREKIAGFLAAIDAKIQQVSAQVAQAETFKKGLLQQMFV